MHVFESVTAQVATQVEKVDSLDIAVVAGRIPRRSDSRCPGCDDGDCEGKTKAPVYMMAYSTTGRKRKEDVTHSRWLVVDWDAQELPNVKTEHVAVPTHRGRWHILLRLERDATREEYAATAEAFAKRYGSASDPRARNIERLLYAPHRDALVRYGGVGSLPVEKPVLAPVAAPQLPITRRAPSRRFREQWVSAMVASPSGNNWLAGALGGVLARNCGYTNDEIAQTMGAWLGGVDPKFDKHVDDAQRAADSARAGNPIQGIPKLAEAGIVFGLEDEWSLDQLPEDDDGLLAAAGGRVWTAATIADRPLPPVPWLCERWGLTVGAPIILAGSGGVGKTWLVQALAVAVSSERGLWLGETVTHGAVLHIDHEQTGNQTHRRYQQLGLNGKAPLVHIEQPKWRLSSDRGLEWLARACERRKLVLIDSLRATTPGRDENDSTIRELLDPLTAVSNDTGCTIVIIHHARKRAKDERSTIRGSSAIVDAAGAALGMQRDNGDLTLWLEKTREKGALTRDLFQDASILIEDVADGQTVVRTTDVGEEPYAQIKAVVQSLPPGMSYREVGRAARGWRIDEANRWYKQTHQAPPVTASRENASDDGRQ